MEYALESLKKVLMIWKKYSSLTNIILKKFPIVVCFGEVLDQNYFH